MRRRHQHRRRHGGRLVHHSLLQVPLDLRQQARVGDRRQDPDGVCAVEVDGRVHVLHQAAGDDDDLVRAGAHVLDDEVDHAAQGRVPGLEELGHAEKDLGRLFFGEGLPLDEEVEELGDDLLAAAGVDVGVVEAPGVLESGALFDAVEGGVLDCWLRVGFFFVCV